MKVDDILVNEFKLDRGFANNDTFDIKVQSNPYKDGRMTVESFETVFANGNEGCLYLG